MSRGLEVTCISDDVCKIQLIGDVDVYSAPKLHEKLLHCLTECEKLSGESFQIDISKVDFLDSAGLSLLITAWRKSQEKSRQFSVLGANKHVRRVIEITGLTFLLGD